MEYIWIDLQYLNDIYKNLINNYFINKTGKYRIENDILYVNFDNWGIEKFYINNNIHNKYYDIVYNNINKIYSIALLIQIGNWNIFLKMENYIKNFNNININIYFSIINDETTNNNITYLKQKYINNIVIIKSENKGMDIGLFLTTLHYINKQNYKHDYFIKIHTKSCDKFRNRTLNNLIGSNDIIINNIKKFNNPKIGMISGNNRISFSTHKNLFIHNLYYLNDLIKQLYNSNIDYNNLQFSGGTFFIIKYNSLNKLSIDNIEYIYNKLNTINSLDYYWYSRFYKLDINNKTKIYNDYNNNKKNRYPNTINYSIRTNKRILRDSMVEHAVERLFGYICKKNNLEII